MKVSIVTISYNSAETIEDTIQSVLAQDYNDLEYIIIDGASTDGTLEIIEKYQDRIAKIVSEPDKGIYNAMNKGINLVSGEVVGILNSDDTYAHPEVISRIATLFQNTGADTCYADLQYVRRDKPAEVVRHWKAGSYRRASFLNGWMPPHPTFFAKAELYQKYGGFNESFKISADYELMLRLLYRHEATAAYLPEVITKMKTGGMSNASLHNRLAANREDRMAWKVNNLKPGVLTIQLKPFRKLGQFLKR